MAPTPDKAASGKAVNRETNANTGKSAAAAQESSVKITPAEEAQQSPSGQQSENENLKSLPTLPSSSSSEDIYDLFAPPVSDRGRRMRPNMTVVTAADSVLTGSCGDDDGVVLPPFRGMVSFGVWVQSNNLKC
jgi:hypothetical protein